MKKIFLIGLLLFSIQSCWYYHDDDKPVVEPAYSSQFEPILMERANFDESIKYIETPKAFVNNQDLKGVDYTKVGKIYSFPPYIFINQLHKGFHVIDNKDPKNPKKIGFLEAPGSTDMVIKNNVILLNHATDLVSFSFHNRQVKMEKRLKDIFPVLMSPDNFYHESPQGKVIVGFKKKES